MVSVAAGWFVPALGCSQVRTILRLQRLVRRYRAATSFEMVSTETTAKPDWVPLVRSDDRAELPSEWPRRFIQSGFEMVSRVFRAVL